MDRGWSKGRGKGSGDSGAVGADHAADLRATGPAARKPYRLACCKPALLQPRCQGASSPGRLTAVTRRTTIHCGDDEPLDLIGHVEARGEAPNVLLLMDDARSGNGTRRVKEW
jgi:hypothetical protein